MSSVQTLTGSSAVTNKGKTPRRRRNKGAQGNEDKNTDNTETQQNLKLLKLPKQRRVPSPLRMTHANPHTNDDFHSSPDSFPSSPSHFQRVFPSPPASPSRLADTRPVAGIPVPQRTLSPASADDSPLPSPPLDDKAYDSGRMSMSSFRSFSSGRPTSLSSVTSSISSRTSRGSDYFSSASSSGQNDQITSYRLGLQTVLPDLDESDSVDRLVLDPDPSIEQDDQKADIGPHENNRNGADGLTTNHLLDNKAETTRASAFNRQSKDLNDVDHLSPVANLAMLSSPHLSYVDRVILELLETERMYVRSLRDILTGYLAVIRSTPDLNIHPDDVEDLFGNIRDIYDFNRSLLREIEDCYGDPKKVAECFVTKDEDFRVYTEYCTNYPSSVAAMTRCMRNPALADFFKVQQDDLRHTLPLGSYLLKPVQRVLKYHLLLQELVKHCDKQGEGYPIIQTALQTMTRVARHINEMKRRHEDAVHIQEIQSLLTNWQGNELTTYGELIMESEMKMQGAKNERQVFLFEKMILITKRREDGYLVCKANIMCANLVLLESVPNIPLGFQVQPYAENIACFNPQPATKQANGGPAEQRLQRYTLLAPTLEEKSQWTYHIKRLIIETMRAAVPLKAKKSIMRMKPTRDGDSGDSGEDCMPIKAKPRFGSSAILTTQDTKSTKSPLSRFGSSHSSTNLLAGVGTGNKKSNAPPPIVAPKMRRRSESTSRKTLHKRALRRKDEMESSDDISSDSVPTTPSGVKAGKFTFPGLRQSVRSGNTQQLGAKTAPPKPATDDKPASKEEANKTNIKAKSNANSNQKNGTKPHHQSVIYRRHKRRTSQPITITEKRLSMKLPDDDDAEKNENGNAEAEEDEIDDLLNFNPLAARESVSWDIQIVEAVFERYKKESPQPAAPVPDRCEEYEATPLGSTYLTVPSDIAPSPLLSLDHTPILSQRRKSRIVVVPSSDTSDDDTRKKMPALSASSILRRKKDRSKNTFGRTSGVVYTLPQNDEADSDSGVSDAKALLRKAAQVSDNIRHSKVIHESDTDLETNIVLKEQAVVARRKSSLRRRERNQRRRVNSENSSAKSSTESLSVSRASDDESTTVQSATTHIGRNRTILSSNSKGANAITSSVQSMSTQTISRADSRASSSTTSMVSVQSTSFVSTASSGSFVDDARSLNGNNNNSKQKDTSSQTPKGWRSRLAVSKDIQDIPAGKVRGLLEKLRKTSDSDTPKHNGPMSPHHRTRVMSPTVSSMKTRFSYDIPSCDKQRSARESASPVSSGMTTYPTTKILGACGNFNSNNNNNHSNASTSNSSAAINETKRKTTTEEKKVASITKTDAVSSEDSFTNGKNGLLKIPTLTTESLPLTLTSSSESEADSDPTIAQRVKRLSRSDYDKVVSGGEEVAPNTPEPKNLMPALFLRRTFSQEDRTNTRRSRNLFLEARMSGEYTEDTPMMIFRGVPENEGADDVNKTLASASRPKSQESSNEVKHYLFEKLCLETPKESNVTDKMSEEFEHLCSDLEGNLHHSSHESHAFSTSEDDGTLSGSSFSSKPTNTADANTLHRLRRQPTTDKNTVQPIAETMSVEQPKIVQVTQAQQENVARRILVKHTQSILPSRSDSICSTRSEITDKNVLQNDAQRGDEPSEASRGRPTSLRSRNSFCARFPAKDMGVIPQRNVMRLMKQFSEITKESEKVAHHPPRRSKSVGGGSQYKSRWRKEKSAEAASTPPIAQEEVQITEKRGRPVGRSISIKSIQLSPMKCTEEPKERQYSTHSSTTCNANQAPESVGETTGLTSHPKENGEDGDEADDVFASPTSPPNLNGDSNTAKESNDLNKSEKSEKKISLVEMFAANPHRAPEEPIIEAEKPTVEAEKISQAAPDASSTDRVHGVIPGLGRHSPSVKVFLVHNDAKGTGTLEPRVLNLGSSVEDCRLNNNQEDISRRDMKAAVSPLDPEKRHSWTNRSGTDTELTVRTRLRSSSFTRCKRKGMLFAESSAMSVKNIPGDAH